VPIRENHSISQTEETQVAYETLLAFIYPYLGEADENVIRGAADEMLSILKQERVNDPEKLKQAKLILPEMREDHFAKLVQISKRINDYSSSSIDEDEDHAMMNDNDDIGISLVFNEEDEVEGDSSGMGGNKRKRGGELNYVVESDDEQEDEEDEEDQKNDAGESMEDEDESSAPQNIGYNRRHGGAHKEDGSEDTSDPDYIDPSSIDVDWLPNELKQYYGDASTTNNVSSQVYDILQLNDDRDCENKLVQLLEFDKFKLIQKLMKNRWKIVYCVKLKRAGDDHEAKRKIQEEMRANEQLAPILQKLHAASRRKQPSAETKMEIDERDERNELPPQV